MTFGVGRTRDLLKLEQVAKDKRIFHSRFPDRTGKCEKSLSLCFLSRGQQVGADFSCFLSLF